MPKTGKKYLHVLKCVKKGLHTLEYTKNKLVGT
jgi:hypothetical protein